MWKARSMVVQIVVFRVSGHSTGVSCLHTINSSGLGETWMSGVSLRMRCVKTPEAVARVHYREGSDDGGEPRRELERDITVAEASKRIYVRHRPPLKVRTPLAWMDICWSHRRDCRPAPHLTKIGVKALLPWVTPQKPRRQEDVPSSFFRSSQAPVPRPRMYLLDREKCWRAA
jgi:hypothetical protein